MRATTLKRVVAALGATLALSSAGPAAAGLVMTGTLNGEGNLVAIAGQANIFTLGFEGPFGFDNEIPIVEADILSVSLVAEATTVTGPLASFAGLVPPPVVTTLYGNPSSGGVLGPWSWSPSSAPDLPFVSADGFSFVFQPGDAVDLLQASLLLPSDVPAGRVSFVLRYSFSSISLEEQQVDREFTLDVVAVPEPGGLALVLAGLCMLGALVRRRTLPTHP